MILADLGASQYAVSAAIAGGALGILGVALLRPRRSKSVLLLNGALAVVLVGGIVAIEQLPFASPLLAANLIAAGGAGLVAAALLALREARQSDAAARTSAADSDAQRRSIETLGAANVRLEDELRGTRAKLSAATKAEDDSTRTSTSALRARQALEAAQAVERKHRAVFEGAVEGMAMLERDSLKLVDANPSLERLTGLTRAELLDRTVYQLFADGPNRPAKPDLQRAGRERRAIRGELARKEGGNLHVDLTLSVIGAENESQLLAVLRDVSGRHTADQEAEEAVVSLRERERRLMGTVKALESRVAVMEGEAGRLREVSAEKDHLVAIVSHELRTPLTSIASFSEILLDHPEVETAVRDEFIGIIHKESGRLTRLVNGVLDLARIEAGETRLEFAEFAAADVIGDAVGSVSGAAAQTDVSIVSDVGSVPRMLYADRDRIQQLLVNLLANAVKFSPHGSEVRIELTDSAHPSRIEITVTDQGPGIAPADLERVFEKFRRAADAPARGVDGTGLGLAICREIATMHGGAITVDSAPGRGSRFSVSLPSAEEARSATARGKKPVSVPIPSATEIPVLTPVAASAKPKMSETAPLRDPAKAAKRELRRPPAEPRRPQTETLRGAIDAKRGGAEHAWSTTGSLPPLGGIAQRTSRRDTNSTTGELPPIR